MSTPRRILVSVLLLALPLAAQAAPERNVHASLVGETVSVRAGQPFTVGLRLEMAEKWHTYWKNPGDSGLATRIRWTLPEGFAAGPFQWPLPQRIAAGPLMSFGYEHEVLLLTEITPPPGLAAGAPVHIAARVDWLECKEACLPGRADLELTLPVEAKAPAADAGPARLFAEARRSLPQAPVGFAVSAAVEGGAVVLSWPAPPGPRETAVWFVPETKQVVEYASAQELQASGGGQRLRIVRDANPVASPRLRGVLVASSAEGTRAYEVDAPLAGGTSAAPGPGAAAPAVPGAPAAPATATGGHVASLGAALLFSFVGGLLLNLMPCVLPVLSFKVLGFVRRADSEGRGAWRHGAAFTLGVLLSFWALGLVLLALRAAGQKVGWGFQLQSPGFVAFLVCLFCLLALNLFGVFEMGGSLVATGGLVQQKTGLAASFWGGALATLVATPCSAPFMGSAVGFGLSQSALASMLVFTFLGLGMAAPYVVLACTPRLLRFVPRPGPWMEGFKQLMGFFLLATVVGLVWVFGQQTGNDAVAILLAALVVVSIGAWWYGRINRPGVDPPRLLAQALPALVVAAGLALAFLPARARAAGPAALARGGEWQVYSAERVESLRRAGPVLVDFGAAWCLSCQVNERFVLTDPEVKAALKEKGVALVRADWTLKDEAITAALASHGRQGVPLYVLYGRDPAREPELLPEVLSSRLVLDALARMPEKAIP